jgi:hypothetical protein
MRRIAIGGFTVLVLAALALLFQACGGMGSGGARERMSLGSGMDKKSSAPAYDAAEDGGAQNYDSSYRIASGTAGTAAGAAAPPPAFGQITASPLLAGASDELAKLNAWLSPAAYAADNNIDERYLIRSGEIALNVDDFNPVRQQVTQVALKHGGTVTNADIAKTGDGMLNGYITLRVPNSKFFEAYEELLALGEVASQKMSSQDVSQDYVASISRLKTLAAQQATLRKLLEESVEVQRKRGLGEGYKMLLDTEQRLSDVSNQIQSVEDQLSSLADSINRSTITVQLSERAKVQKEEFAWGMGATFDRAKKDLALGLRGWGQGLIYFFVTCWLWLLPWSAFIFVLWKLFKRYLLPRLREIKPAAHTTVL